MKKQYDKILIQIFFLDEDIVRTSSLDDPFDDSYKDPNLDYGN